MRNKFFRSSLEKDFEFFVKNLSKLEPVEFFGLAKILSVPMYKSLELAEIDPKNLKDLSEEELEQTKAELILPMDVVLEKMMDRFLELPKRRRKEINNILRDVKRGK